MPTTLRRPIAALIALIGALAVLVGPLAPTGVAQAAPLNCGYPAARCECPSLSISTTVPTPGERLQVTGTGFVPRTTIRFELVPVRDNATNRTYDVGSSQTTASGTLTFSFTMPDGAVGTYDLHGRNGSPRSAVTDAGVTCPVDPSVPLRVDAANDSRGPNSNANNNEPSTAFTGVNLLWLIVAAAVLVGAGLYVNHRGRARKEQVGSSRS